MSSALRFIDLFAGCGGLSLGLHQAGWQGCFAVERNRQAFDTYRHNLITKFSYDWPSWLPQEAISVEKLISNHKKELKKLRGEIELVAGGPPCQGFSTAGKRLENDDRNLLVYSYLEIIKLVQPKLLLFENVKGFASQFSANGESSRIFASETLKALKDLGYKDAKAKLIDFSEYGLPQKRTRLLIVASLDGKAATFFDQLAIHSAKFLNEIEIKLPNSTGDALSDLRAIQGTKQSPDSSKFLVGKYGYSSSPYQRYLRGGARKNQWPDSHRFSNHNNDTKKVFLTLLSKAPRLRCISGDDRHRYGVKKRSVTVLAESAPSPTVTSIPDDCIHYEEPRVLTARECARLQGFPDWYEFQGKYTTGGKMRVQETPRFTQIGNAVPPFFAIQAGTVLKTLLD